MLDHHVNVLFVPAKAEFDFSTRSHMISEPFPDDGDLCPAHPQLRLLGILPGSRQVAGQSLQGGKGLFFFGDKKLFALKGHLEKSCVLLSSLRGNKRFLQAVHHL